MYLYPAIVLILDGFVILKFGYMAFMKFYPLTVHLPVYLGFMFVSKFKPIKVFFVHLTLVAISMSLSIVGIIISYFLGSSSATVNIVCYILYLPAGVFIYKYIRPPFLYMLRHTDKGWIGFCAIPFSYSLLIYISGTYNIGMVVPESILNTVLLFISTFAAYLFVDNMPVSTEEDHGLGTRSIAAVTQKYGGIYSFTAEEVLFKVSIIL